MSPTQTLYNTTRREKEYEKKQDEKVVMEVKDDKKEGKRLSEEIEEVHRLGKYEVGKIRLLKITIRSQAGVEEILEGSWMLGRIEEYKNVWLRCDLNEEEEPILRLLWETAKRKKINLNRTVEERINYYWKLKDMRLRKWYTRKTNKWEISITVEEEEN
ncbi:hypothetical protein E2C01_026964 [Portunus trituberculatus]|uniref:Uncharacterized protein n=1 Tax=Portunus trituberculatus TaxID=210409 RepID=A0A5B7EKE5_PORTR|nr:hypothetical protein [Portunus trituberculatus]